MSQPLTPTSFIEAATEILVEEGLENLSIVSLCARLRVSRGSFYHHFTSLADFEDSYIEHFERHRAAELLDEIDAAASFRDRSEIAMRLAEKANFSAERAVRTWALTDDRVAAMLARVEHHYIEVIARSIRSAGGSPAQARDYAELVLAVWIGLVMRRDVPQPDLVRRLYRELEWAANARAHHDAQADAVSPQ